jgi:hypothetical protein
MGVIEFPSQHVEPLLKKQSYAGPHGNFITAVHLQHLLLADMALASLGAVEV